MGKNKPVDESNPETLKQAGNKAYLAREFEKAVMYFTKAIEINPKNHIYYANSK
jgi:stress-induced-phosphoprotein 1